MEPVNLSLERIYPKHIQTNNSNEQHTLNIHLERYQFAAQHLQGEHILDIACGCGYGCYLMAQQHFNKLFTGVDIDPNATAYAQEHYALDNLQFISGDACTFTSPDKFTTIISLETIEHVPSPNQLVANLSSLLSPEGLFIASVPTTPTCDGNPHTFHDFTPKSFSQLFAQSGLHAEDNKNLIQIQPWSSEGAFEKASGDNSE